MPNGTDRFCGNRCAGVWKYRNQPATKAGLSIGQTHPNRIAAVSAAARARAGQPRPNMRGENNPNWKGGTYGTERHAAMGQIAYKNWRTAVFQRDDYTCQMCNERGGRIQADHIVPWCESVELRYSTENGRTLCVSCHQQVTADWRRQSKERVGPDGH